MKDAASDGEYANECTYALHVKDPSSDTHHHPTHHTHAHLRHLSLPHPVAPPPTHSSLHHAPWLPRRLEHKHLSKQLESQ